MAGTAEAQKIKVMKIKVLDEKQKNRLRLLRCPSVGVGRTFRLLVFSALRQNSCSWFKCRQGKKRTLVTIEEVWRSHPADSNDPGEVSELHGRFLRLSCLKPMRPDYSRTQFGGSQTNCGGIVSLA